MAPLPNSNTARLLIDYRVGGVDRHTLMTRWGPSTDKDTATLKMNDLLTELAPAFYTDTVFESARWADKGDDFSFPVSWSPINGSTAPGSRPLDFRARFLSFVGRGVDARNWHLSLFGATLIVDANFIILDSEAPALVAVRDAMLDLPDPVVTISESEIVPLNYFTTRVSAYWQRRIARTG